MFQRYDSGVQPLVLVLVHRHVAEQCQCMATSPIVSTLNMSWLLVGCPVLCVLLCVRYRVSKNCKILQAFSGRLLFPKWCVICVTKCAVCSCAGEVRCVGPIFKVWTSAADD